MDAWNGSMFYLHRGGKDISTGRPLRKSLFEVTFIDRRAREERLGMGQEEGTEVLKPVLFKKRAASSGRGNAGGVRGLQGTETCGKEVSSEKLHLGLATKNKEARRKWGLLEKGESEAEPFPLSVRGTRNTGEGYGI